MITGPRDTIKRARKLRREMSPPQARLWQELRKRPGGYKFRREHGAGKYILDFYCAKAKLAIEVDGWRHDTEQVQRSDQARSAWLRSQGVATTRIPAKLIKNDVGAVILRLVKICDERVAQMDGPSE